MNLLLLHDIPSGTTRIHDGNDDGSVGSVTHNVTLPPGLSQVEIYDTDSGQYMLRLNETTGDLTIRRVNWDGSISAPQHTRNWTAGWTSAATYDVDGDPHLFVLKESGI